MSVELDMRDYLREQETLMSLLNDDPKRLNMDWTGNLNATHVTLYLAGGSMNDHNPLSRPVLGIHCFGSTRSAAAALSDEVAKQIRAIGPEDRPLCSATVESVVYLPTTDGVARYVVTTAVTYNLGLAA